MKRLRAIGSWTGAAVVAASLLAVCQGAWAQDKVGASPDREETVKINVSGEVDLDYVYRSRGLTAFTQSVEKDTAITPPTPAEANSENTVEGFAAFRVDVELSKNVSARVEFGTRRVDIVDQGGTSQEQINQLGNDGGQEPVLRELAIILSEFLSPGLTVELGIPNWSFDVQGRGSSFFAPRRSQTIVRNLDSIGGTGTTATTQETDTDRLLEAEFPNELDPVGAWARYEQGNWIIDIVALPAVIEGGDASSDEAFYAIDGFYKLGENGSRIGVLGGLSAFQPENAGGGDTGIITVGGGLVLNDILVGGLQIYGEAYFQTGDAGDDGAGTTFDAAGFAAQGGIEYRHLVGNPMPIWAGVKVTHFSGDGDSAGDQDVDRFVSYENINDLLIIESMYYGFDVDSNYTAIKVYAGLDCSLVDENDLEVSAIVGFTNMSEDILFGGTTAEDALGTEVDVKSEWSLSKQVVIGAAVAFLFGSDVLEQSMGGPGSGFSEDSAIMFTAGADLKF